jgi:tetratricopeptide (TPR) repeat protein
MAFDRLARTFYMLKDRVLAIKHSVEALNLLKSINCKDIDYARCLQTQGLCYSLCSEYTRSKYCFEEALECLETITDKSEALAKVHIYESYSRVLAEQGDLQEAVNKTLQGNDILKTLNYNPGRMTYLENACHNISSPASIEGIVDEMLEIVNEVYGNTDEAANIYGLATECKYLNDNYEEALSIAEKELNIYKQNNDLKSILESYMTISKIYLSLDDIEKAKSYIDLSEGMLKKHPSRLLQAELYYYKYYYHYKIEEDDQAEKYLEMSIQETIEDEDSKDQLIQRYTELGNLCQIRTKLDRAKECFEKALDLNRKHRGKDNMETASLIGNIGNVHAMMKNYEKALEMMFDSLELKQKLVGTEHHELISAYSMISSTYYMMKEYSLSLEYCEMTKELVRKINGENDIELGHLYVMMGEIYGNTMNRAKAKSSYLQAKEVFSENGQQELIDHVMKKIDELDRL